MSRRTPYALEQNSTYKQYLLRQQYASLSHARLMALQTAPPVHRRAAAEVLVARNSKAVFRDALVLCRNASPILREQGATILEQLRYPDSPQGDAYWKTVYETLHALASDDPRAIVRAEALRALARCGASDEILLAAAEKGAQDKTPTVRVFAAYLIGQLPFPGVRGIVARLLLDSDKHVQEWIAYAIYFRTEFGENASSCDSPEIRESLLRLTAYPHYWTRFEALRALGALREKRAVPMLVKALGDEYEFDYALAESAAAIGDPVFIAALEEAMERFGDDLLRSIEKALAILHGEYAYTPEMRRP